MRGYRNAGNDALATPALRRESYGYPIVALRMRGSSCCLWSSSLFPDCLLTRLPPPPIFTASGRLPAGAVNTASGMPRTIAPTIAGGTARGQRGNMRFSFQECIAATGGRLRRSSTDEKQSHRRPRDAVRGAACVCYRTSVSELRIARCRFGTMDTSTPENGLPPGFRGLAASCGRVARAPRAFAQSVRAYGKGPIARSMQRQTDYPKIRLIHP